MTTISASIVRELRERSGAGMMDCKKALEATGGDIEAAFDHLRKQGLKSAEKKAGREMGEGRVFAQISDDGRSGSLVAVTCETDFVAKTPDFESFLTDLANHVLNEKPADTDAVLAQTWAATGSTVEETLKLVVGKLGENISVGRLAHFENTGGFVYSYVHHNGKVGTLVSVTTSADAAKAEETLKDLCMHIAFSKPTAMSRDEVPGDVVEREKAIYMEEVAGKPDDIKEKIVAGKLDKFYGGQVLPDQPWFKDDKQSVQKVLQAQLGQDAKIEGFACFVVGG